MDDFLKSIGTRIMLRRKELKLTQDNVAERAGLTTQTISTAERGEKALRPENIVKISAALDVTPNYLLLGEMSEAHVGERSSRLARLTPLQRKYLENIIDNYIAAVSAAD